MTAVRRRHDKWAKWEVLPAERIAIVETMDAHEAITDASSPLQMYGRRLMWCAGCAEEHEDSMTTTETETLFRKVGRRYIPAYSLSEWSYDKGTLMKAGSFLPCARLQRRRAQVRHEVTPDTAGWWLLRRWQRACHDRGYPQGQPAHDRKREAVDEKQQAAIKQANAILEAAGIWSGRGWTTAQAYDVAQADIDAVTQWANQPKDTK